MERYTYTVQADDTLTKIGAKTGVPWQTIFALNRGKSQPVRDAATGRTVTRTLTDKDLIWPGYVLTLGEEPDPVVTPSDPSGEKGSGLGMLATIAGAVFFLMS